MTLKLKSPAVLFEGGPWAGWSRYANEMDETVRVAEYFGGHFPYQPTDRQAVHPQAGGKITSQVWEYTG